MSATYYICAAVVYAIVATIAAFVIIFGRRARRYVKSERITSLPDGFSPLDVKRIFIGKTYPRRLTRALICYWAECGYIRVKQLGRYTVRIIRHKPMPEHDSKEAVFFDRGTYVRERDLFNCFINSKNVKAGRAIDIRKPLFTSYEVKMANAYAVREDEGVYSAKHYTLKIVTIVLAIAAALVTQISNCVVGGEGMGMGIMGVFLACIGLSVAMFVRDMPIIFKLVWCGGWLAGSTVTMFVGFSWASDPFGLTVLTVILLYVTPLFIVRFVDYREKNNLDDYSDLINYRKFLFTEKSSELQKLDYYKILPLLYAFRVKTLVKHKFGDPPLPDWFESKDGKKGALL